MFPLTSVSQIPSWLRAVIVPAGVRSMVRGRSAVPSPPPLPPSRIVSAPVKLTGSGVVQAGAVGSQSVAPS